MFYLPTRVIFCDQAVKLGASYFTQLGQKAFIVTGKASSKKTQALDDVLEQLKLHGLTCQVYDSVPENPSLDDVIDGMTELVLDDCDFLIAIGGGSPIDAAKAIALSVANKLDKQNIYNTSLFKCSLPVVAIPTTAGTGSEVTPYSVLTDAEHKKKAGFGSELAFPVLALLDPKYTLTMPYSITLNTGIDALSHLLEGIYSNKRNLFLYPMMFKGIKLIYQNIKKVLDNPMNLEARSAMMQASLYGGITIAHTSTTLQHSIGYPLTSYYGIPHGLANGIVMKDIMELYYPAVNQDLEEMFNELGISKADFYLWLEALQLTIDISLSDEFIEERTGEVLSSRNMANNPFEITAEEIKKIYRRLKS